MAKTALFVLAAGLVLDRSVHVTQTSAEIDATFQTVLNAMAEKRGNNGVPHTLRVVDNANQFFTADNLLDSIKKSDTFAIATIAEQAGVTVSAEQVAAIQSAEATKTAIALAMKPRYDFAEVPAGWSFKADVSFGATHVRRKRENVQGNSTIYAVSSKQLEKLWGVASKRWAKMAKSTNTVSITPVDYPTRTASINETYVDIGCQRIQRYELEQIAAHKGWAFPTTA